MADAKTGEVRRAEYNGWANYETWNVGLWADNEEWIYRQRCRIVEGCRGDDGEIANMDALADALKAWALGIWPDGTPDMRTDDRGERPSRARGRRAMREVDWDELAESWAAE
jgi:hypothetical protein